MSKKFDQIKKLVDKSKLYNIDEAIELLPQVSISKFVGSAELVVNLKLNEKQKQVPIRGSVVFPNTFGQTRKVLVLAEEAKQEEAKKAGADFVGLDDMVKKIEEGWIDFDVVITTPASMPKIARLGKYLGRKGLMPNPKNQTVTNDIEKIVKMYKSGKKDFKASEQGSIKIVFGKLDMSKENLKANFDEFKKAISNDIKRLGSESIKSVFVSPSMGPSIKVNLTSITA